MMRNKSLKDKTISGFFWSISDLIANQGAKFVIQVILARLLVPEDFGIIGMITIFIAISQSIVDSGFKNALIREKDNSQDDLSTVFYFNFISAILLYFTLFTVAPLISRFYNEPQVTQILRVLGTAIIINSFGLIQRTILIKKIDFHTQTKISVISSIFSGIIAITFAYNGAGVWSLVIQTLIMQLVQSILLTFSNRWKPSFAFSIESFRRLFGFGWKILVSGLINTLYQNIYYVIIGKYFTTTTLGYYTNAQKLRDLASQSITTSVQKVSYPALSSIQDDDNRLKMGYKKIIKNSIFLTFPTMIGLAAVAEPFILVVFGEKWINSIQYFQILCFGGALFPLHAINLNVLQVKGRSDLFLRLEVIKKVVGVFSIIIILSLRLGVIGLVWAAALNSIIAYFINSYYSADIINYPIKEQIKDIIPITGVSVVMGVIVYLVGINLEANNLMKLLIQVIIGVISYISISKMVGVKELKTVYDLIRSIINRFMVR